MATPPKSSKPKAPELGAFPLDHFRECSNKIREYFACLERENHLAPKCRNETREYLACRMEKGLMSDQNIGNFGIPETSFVETRNEMKSAVLQAKAQGSEELRRVANNLDKFTGQDGYEVDSAPDTPERY